jgi:hypothetical protein
MNNRTLLIGVICVLAVATVGSFAAYQYERSKPSGVEIRVDRNGLKIEER